MDYMIVTLYRSVLNGLKKKKQLSEVFKDWRKTVSKVVIINGIPVAIWEVDLAVSLILMMAGFSWALV